MKIPDSVCAAYVTEAVKMHGSAGKDIGDTVKGPDSGVKIGQSAKGSIWRLKDGWGTYYFLDPPKGQASFMACKMEDVMACDVSPAYKDVIPYKELGMGDKTWDAAVVKAVGGDLMTTAEKSVDWTSEYINTLPDSAFAFIEPGGVKDAIGKTSPRSLRHLPFKRAEGDVDFEQLAKSIAGVEATNLPVKTKAKILTKLEGIVAKYITHAGDKWQVHSEAGKVLGTHDSKADAVAQLGAIEANKHPKKAADETQVEKIGWTDAAREAAAAARAANRGGKPEDSPFVKPEQNPYHKVLTQHGFKPVSTTAKKNPLVPNRADADYTEHRYEHPKHGKSHVLVTQYHGQTGPYAHDPPASWLFRHEQSNGILAPTTGDTRPQLHHSLLREYGDPGVRPMPDDPRRSTFPEKKDVHWPVDDSRFRGSSLTDAGEKAPNAKKGANKDEEKSFEERYEEFRAQVKDASGPGSKVQSLVFDKEKYPKVKEATGWATDHGFKAGKVDESQDSFRLRQEEPGQFVRMRTISLTEGVQAVVGFPKKSVNAVKEAFFTTETGRLAFKAKSADLFKTEFEPIREADGWTFYCVKYAGKSLFFAEQNGQAQYLPSYELLSKSEWVHVVKGSDEQRYTLSVVYPCSKKGTPEPDFHGDVMSDMELEKSAWSFLEKGNDRIGLMHRPGTTGAGKVVESYIWRGPEWKMKDAGGVDQSVSPGDWVMGIVWTEPAWQAIKSGQITGLSLQGAARKEAF